MAITFDVDSGGMLPDGIKEVPVASSERVSLLVKKVNFTDKSGDGTALQSGEDVTLMVLGANVVVTRAILRITTAFTTGIDIGFCENDDATVDRDEFFDGAAAVGTYVWNGHSTGNATAAIAAASTNPATSTLADYKITLEAKAHQTGDGVADLIVEYYQFL